MTPHRRARVACRTPDTYAGGEIVGRVANQIREAIAEERERCAKIADAAAGETPEDGELWIAQRIAAAIRGAAPPKRPAESKFPTASGFPDP